MTTVAFHKVDETTIYLKSTDTGALMDLHTHFTFEVPNAKFTPAYRNKIWDGRIRLLNSQN